MTRTYTIQDASLSQVRPELEPWLQDYWDAMRSPQDPPVLALHWALYEVLEATERLCCLAARTAEGRLIGFAVAHVNEDPKHVGQGLMAYTHAWYVAPGWRRQGVGQALLRALEHTVREKGARYLALGLSARWPVAALVATAGFLPTQQIYIKRLED